MRTRAIDTLSLVRFIDEFKGEPRGLRGAVAEAFDVGMKTVETELPRLVALGALEEEVLPGKGAPKAYRVSQSWRDRLHSGRPRALAEMIAWRDLPVTNDSYARLLGFIAETLGEAQALSFDQLWREGKAAYCAACVPDLGKTVDLDTATVIDPHMRSDPVCPHHKAVERSATAERDTDDDLRANRLYGDGGDDSHSPKGTTGDTAAVRYVPRPMESAYTFGLVVREMDVSPTAEASLWSEAPDDDWDE